MRKILRLLAVAAASLLLASGTSQAQRIGIGGDRAQAARQASASSEAEAAGQARELEAALGAVRNAPLVRRAPRIVYVFGDSLSDVGNLYLRYAAQFPFYFTPPFAVPRTSNGPMWPDHVARALGTRIEASEQGGTDYAFGGATISPENYLTFDAYATGFAMVDRFLATHGSADPEAIYVVWHGVNDIDPPAEFTRWNFEQLVVMIGRLHAAGARKFLVPTIFDVGKLPSVIKMFPPPYPQQLSDMTVLYNSLLPGLPARFPGAKVMLADAYGLKAMIDRHPRAFGFRNTTDACYQWAPIGDGSYCGDPDSHWFFDWSHPSARGHRLIAGLLLLELAKAGELWRR